MSSAILHGIAVLENPRVVPKLKTTPALIGSFRYFNDKNLQFPDVGCYNVDIRVARTTPTIEVFSQTITPVDYHVVGDIVSLIPLGSPENFDLGYPSFMTVCGVPTNMNREDTTFDLNAEQYLSATRSAEAFLNKYRVI
ncbi:hypothetical protein B0H13DRAFT_1861835 [Mycena leptocephala]|nr:hypothetical protein B0H13DRAFT_1861835 [Mycena leptocephala]